MKTLISNRWDFLGLLGVISILAATPSNGQIADQTSPEAPSFERRIIDQAIKELKVFADEQTEPMQSHVVMRWPNNVRGTRDGATVLLTDGGRPKAACCIYTWQGNELHYGLGSLSTQPVTAEVDGKVAWRPKDSGIEYRPLPGAPAPAGNAALRLRQMRELSRRFGSRYVENATTSDELRLIPKPIYRYELGKPNGDSELIDGAVFAFAQGTDPESLLLIESRRAENGPQWHYATAKRTVGQIDVTLDRKQVQVHSWGGWSPFQPEATFSTLRQPIKRDD